MKLSPEPDWKRRTRPILDKTQDVETQLSALISYLSEHKPPVITIFKQGSDIPLGSFTPEWFLGLEQKDQLQFLTVANRVHRGQTCPT